MVIIGFSMGAEALPFAVNCMDDNEFPICRKDLDGLIDYDLLGGGHYFGKNYVTLSKLIGKRLNLE